MIQIELSREKAEWLRESLGNYGSQLRLEIAKTDNRNFRDFLKKRSEFIEEFLQGLEEKLGPDQAAGRDTGELHHAA